MKSTTFAVIALCVLSSGFQIANSETVTSHKSETDIGSVPTNVETSTSNYLDEIKSPDLVTCHSALVKIRNRDLDSTEVRKALAGLLSDPRPGGRILGDVAILPPRIEAAQLLARRIAYTPLASKRLLAITEEDIKGLREWVAANPKRLNKEKK